MRSRRRPTTRRGGSYILQAAAFLTLFRGELANRKQKLADLKFDTLEAEMPKSKGASAVDEIFADLSKDKTTAARKVLGYLKRQPRPAANYRRGPAANLPQGDRCPRLQVQLGGTGGLCPRLAGLARSLPRGERFLAERLGGKDTDLVRRTKAALA